ncbi:alpha/beta hydrolase family protein [Paradesertivirga mongoliensis]|uniref:Alpha/beta hydrolase family protein n=1 Tax=Paradesertivirga mongoliensis TaxID=2100740 RepID=A0ABW4ZGC7_9SPHI|nr:alpha/beta fold hydrolase [Pedobacter mongoliensis]
MLHHHFSISGASGSRISIDLTLAAGNGLNPLVVFVHGFKGFKDWGTHQLVANHFAQQGFNFLKFNFSHNGISGASGDVFEDLEGFANNTFSKELFDLEQVIDFALSGQSFPAPPRLYLIGHSLGGAICIIKASETKVITKLVTWASISSFRNLWTAEQEQIWINTGVLNFMNSRTNQQMPIYSTLLEDLNYSSERLDVLSAASKISQPWLIVHGEEDTGVTPEQAKLLHAQQSGSQLLIVPNADHVFCAKHPWMEQSLPKELLFVCDATIAFLRESGE